MVSHAHTRQAELSMPTDTNVDRLGGFVPVSIAGNIQVWLPEWQRNG